MKQEELAKILELHEKWLSGEEDGVKAILNNADLKGANLSFANLIDASLRGANLRGANLIGTELRGVDLRDADLSFTILNGVDISGAYLRGANLCGVDLSGANLNGVDLSSAKLNDVDLTGADLRGAILDNVEYNDNTSFFALQCPEKGSFTAYKKADDYVVELFIPKSAKRSSATSRKCRADKAKVVAIYNKDRTKAEITMVESEYDSNFVYEIGKTVSVENFNEDRWEDCTTGIHFFITFDEAKNY